MSTNADEYRPIGPVDTPYEGKDKRRYPRYSLSLPGRFMRSDKLDYDCRLIDISVESAAMTTPVPLRVGENLIVYLMHLGGLEGTVLRLFPGSFAMTIGGTQRKREKLALQIPRLALQGEIPESEEREFPRVSADEAALLVLPDGSTMVCPLHDVSLSGAAIVTPARPPLGAEVMVDKRRAVVVRHHERGIAVEFVSEGHTRLSPLGGGLRASPSR
jgi:hypothetical protein